MSRMREFPSSSLEHLHVAVWAMVGDPTDYDVFIGASDDDTTEPEDWVQGSWLPDSHHIKVDDQFRVAWIAYVLASGTGNGGDLELDAGSHYIWVNFQDVVQSVKRPVEKIKVT